MRIESIERYKGETYRVRLDDDRSFFLHAEIILAEHLKRGCELTEQRFAQILHRSEGRRSRERALHLLGNRDYSEQQLFDKLCESYSEEIAAETVAKMHSLGLINDESYAERLARELLTRKKYGVYRARMAMRQAGLDEELIEETLRREAPEDPSDIICSLIERKYSRAAEDPDVRRRAIAALQRRGFSYEEIRHALQQYTDILSEEQENQL